MIGILDAIGKVIGLTQKAKLSSGDLMTIVNAQGKISEEQAKVIISEIKGGSWLQRNWRPMSMIVFLVLICFDAFEILPSRLPSYAWDLFTIGFTGYVGARTVDKLFGK